MSTETATWVGDSGKRYLYNVYSVSDNFNDVAGNYILTKSNYDGSWYAIYVGETSSFRDRLNSSHEKWPCANSYGMTHIHAHINGLRADRLVEESDLIRLLNPPCND